MERALEIRVEHGVPIVVGHAHQQLIARDAGIVDEHINPPVLRHRRFNQPLRVVALAHVALHERRLPARVVDGLRRLLRRRLATPVVDDHRCAIPREPYRHRPPNPPARPGDNNNLPLRITRHR